MMSESKPLFERHKLGLETIAQLIYQDGVFPPWKLESAKIEGVTLTNSNAVDEFITRMEMTITCYPPLDTNIQRFTAFCYPDGVCFVQDIHYGGGTKLDTGLYIFP